MSFTSHASSIEVRDDRMIAAMRLILAVSAVLIIYIDPSEPDRYVAVTATALALYVAYSTTLLACAWRRISYSLAAMAHWVDVGWYVLLIGLSSGTHSIFFFFFFFAILVASFRWGFASGLRVALVSAALFSVVGLATAPAEPGFELNRFLLRPLSLLGLGYMMAYWGGCEVVLKRRLALLKDVSALANPRFGVDRMLGSLMEQLRTFYDADACLLVTADSPMRGPSWRCVDRRDPEAGVRAEPISEGLGRFLLDLPATQAVVSRRVPRLWTRWYPAAGGYAYDVATGKRMAVPPQASGVLAAESCVTVPWCTGHDTLWRLYLTASRRYAFALSDVHFLLQVLEHAMPTIENIRLVDQLASTAADVERQRLVHDLHDSMIQPYIALQLGLAAVYQKVSPCRTAFRGDLEKLLALTEMGVTDLRRYTSGLQSSASGASGLLPALRRFTERFARVTGIAVHIEAEPSVGVPDRLAAEALQMVAEGLSNVRRHTCSPRATIGLACNNGHFTLRIANDVPTGSAPVAFIPRSIAARAAALGGRVRSGQADGNSTVVTVDIPL